ncbi:LpxI family protein [Pararhodobacter oceanensis]|uniref:LpxI family protein n=1 Tax=Pararhodobacter oceanensis TaxID=2172121 RepID=UPI003A947AE8
MSRLALVAGTGRLPLELTQALTEPPLICALEGNTPEGLEVDVRFSLSRLVPFLRHLGDQGVESVALVGAMNRPRLDPEHFDRDTASLMPDLMRALQQGDDGALRWLMALLEEFDFTLKGVAELAPELLAAEGVLTARAPNHAEQADAARGTEILAALDPQDVGQGCVVAARLCLAVEALYGTDIMLEHVASARDQREPTAGGVLVKRAKRGQDLRADIPAIGPDTIEALRAARLTGVCLQAAHTLILDRSRTLAAAEAAGLTIWATP